MDYIKVNNLSFVYDAEPVLENVAFRISAGEFVTLTGENGAEGIRFTEFTYQLLQGFDFLHLYQNKNVKVVYNPKQITLEQIKKAINEIGYKAK